MQGTGVLTLPGGRPVELPVSDILPGPIEKHPDSDFIVCLFGDLEILNCRRQNLPPSWNLIQKVIYHK